MPRHGHFLSLYLGWWNLLIITRPMAGEWGMHWTFVIGWIYVEGLWYVREYAGHQSYKGGQNIQGLCLAAFTGLQRKCGSVHVKTAPEPGSWICPERWCFSDTESHRKRTNLQSPQIPDEQQMLPLKFVITGQSNRKSGAQWLGCCSGLGAPTPTIELLESEETLSYTQHSWPTFYSPALLWHCPSKWPAIGPAPNSRAIPYSKFICVV